MKLAYLFIVISIFGFQTFAQNNEKTFKHIADYPDYQTIVYYFLVNFEPQEFMSDNFIQFRFARDPKGWKIISESTDGKAIRIDNTFYLWNRKKGYLDMDTIKNQIGEINSPGLASKLLTNDLRYNFGIHPFYGYIGWEKDIVKFYKRVSLSKLSNHEKYGISKAYGSLATSILWDHSAFSDPQLLKGTNAKKNNIRRYIRYSLSSIKYLNSIDPNYQTRVGNIDVKKANEIMARYYELTLFGWNTEAELFFSEASPDDKNIYESFWVNMSDYILKNLKQDAILFTFGDDDTYPYLWNQLINNYRKDILVVNISLLNDPRYYTQLKESFPDNFGSGSGIKEPDWLLFKDAMIFAANDTGRFSIDIEGQLYEMFQQIKSGNKDYITMEYGYLRIPPNKLADSSDSLIMLNAVSRQISLNQIFTQYILYNNYPNRPVYFSKPMASDIEWMFNYDNILDEGFVYRLTTEASSYPEFNYRYYDREKIEKILDTRPIALPSLNLTARMNFYQLMLELESREVSINLTKRGLPEDEEKLMNFLEAYPPYKTGVSLHYYNMIYTLFKCKGKKEIATMFLKAFLDQLEAEIRNTKMMDSDPDDFDHLRFLDFLIESIMRSELEPGFPGYYENLVSYQDSIRKKLRQYPELKIEY